MRRPTGASEARGVVKQRIHAEAHGKSPGCRHRPLSETDTDAEAEQ
ncbi:DUF6344 domain-containing protein, partial [Streptomyces werraensis]